MARPKSAVHDLRRDEILEIAAACFAAQGYPVASMNDIAQACGTSKARLYHYYESKEALLFDLLDRYTQQLLALIATSEAAAERGKLDDLAALHALVRAFLLEYERAGTRHVALVTATPYLAPELRERILDRQRDVVSAVMRHLRRAYPERFTPRNQSALTMMLFGMINWTFTWLKPDGPLSYEAFAEEVIQLLEHGFSGSGSSA